MNDPYLFLISTCGLVTMINLNDIGASMSEPSYPINTMCVCVENIPMILSMGRSTPRSYCNVHVDMSDLALDLARP